MHVGKTLFALVMEFVPWTSFARIVQRHGGNSGVRTLSCAEQFRAMAFAQLTWRESLRDIEARLSANSGKLYAMGFRSAVKRSTLADANESRDWRIRSDLAALLIRRARKPTRPASINAQVPGSGIALSRRSSSTTPVVLHDNGWVHSSEGVMPMRRHSLQPSKPPHTALQAVTFTQVSSTTPRVWSS
jgi:hypothetical protein